MIGAATIEFVGTLHHAGYNPAGLVVIAGTVGLLWARSSAARRPIPS